MHNLSENFMIILSIVKQSLKDSLDCHGNLSRPGPSPKFSDAAVIALSLLSDALMFDSENYLFRYLSNHRHPVFTKLIERSRYNRRRRQLHPLIEKVRMNLVRELAEGETVFLLDSMPIEICKFARARRLRICKHDYETAPSFAYSASQMKSYYGYKLHTVMTCNGVITHFALTKAHIADIHYLQQIKKFYSGCLFIADRAYLNNPLQQELFNEYRLLVNTPMRRNQRNYRSQPAAFKRTRRRIETAFSQLNDQFDIQKNYAKSFAGFATRILSKITSMTISQFVNMLDGQYPINQIKHAWL